MTALIAIWTSVFNRSYGILWITCDDTHIEIISVHASIEGSMSSPVIQIENLSKLYRLGQVGTGTLRHDLQRWWASTRGKEDPFAKIGQLNDRTKKAQSDYVWALKDLSFDVQEGEVLGIIGANGAGKSTLLKILSKITSPTTGSVKLRGRTASLLEVGTGFHPEMTGRENIFLNGAILGMRRQEIQKKFDAIVDFAGVEAYIDTPVKRYSSGMYVRLAFAVAAFLEPEILIVDEVLAVGDAEFQQKCLGRMKNVSLNYGRTVLFVSHNMAAVQNLCAKGLLLLEGQMRFLGDIDNAVSTYLDSSIKHKKIDFENYNQRSGAGLVRIQNIFIAQNGMRNVHKICSLKEVSFVIKYDCLQSIKSAASRIDVGINDCYGTRIAWFSTWNKNFALNDDDNLLTFKIKYFNLVPGHYSCNVFCEINGIISDWIHNAIAFYVVEDDYYLSGRTIPPNQGNILLDYAVSSTCE